MNAEILLHGDKKGIIIILCFCNALFIPDGIIPAINYIYAANLD